MSFYFRPSQHYVNFYLYFHSLTTPIKTEIHNAVHGLLAVCCCVYFIFKVKILSQKQKLLALELWGMLIYLKYSVLQKGILIFY